MEGKTRATEEVLRHWSSTTDATKPAKWNISLIFVMAHHCRAKHLQDKYRDLWKQNCVVMYAKHMMEPLHLFQLLDITLLGVNLSIIYSQLSVVLMWGTVSSRWEDVAKEGIVVGLSLSNAEHKEGHLMELGPGTKLLGCPESTNQCLTPSSAMTHYFM